MALTELDKLLPYEEWKMSNPVDYRGLPLATNKMEERLLRAAYADYVRTGTPQANIDERSMLNDLANSSIARVLEDETEEGLIKGVQTAYDDYYAVSTDEKVQRIFNEAYDGGVRGSAPAFNFLSETGEMAINLRQQLSDFNKTKYNDIKDKIDKISGPNKRKPTTKLNYVDGKAVFRSEADDFPELWTVTEEEQAYVDRFTPLMSAYAEEMWPEFKKLMQKQLGAAVIQVPFTDPDTGESRANFLFADDIPDDRKEEALNISVREGLIDPRFKDFAADALDKGRLLEGDKRRSLKEGNYYQARQMIFTALRQSDVEESGGPQSKMSGQLSNLMKQVSLTHTEAGESDVVPFVTTPQGSFLGQTELVKNKRGELVNQDFTAAIEVFRDIYEGSASHLSDEVIGQALQSTAYEMAAGASLMPYHAAKTRLLRQDEKALSKDSASRIANNIYTTEFGEKIIHPQLYVVKKDFETLLEKAEELGTTKESLRLKRLNYLDSNYDSFIETIKNSTADIRDSWNEHVTKAVDSLPLYKTPESGEVGPPELLDKSSLTPDMLRDSSNVQPFRLETMASWLDTESGRNWFNRVGQSAAQGAADLVGSLSMFAGSLVGDAVSFYSEGTFERDRTDAEKFGIDIITNSAREREANRALAAMFGRNQTYGDMLSTMAVPLIIDIGASFVLAAPTGGLATTAVASSALAKSGYAATSKAYAQSLFGFGLRNILKEGAEDTAERSLQKAIAKGYIKKLPSVKKAGKKADELLGTPKLTRPTITPQASRGSSVLMGDTISTRGRAAMDALKGISVGLKRSQYPAIAAPAFLRSSSHTYGDIYMSLQGATGPDGKPLTADEIHDRAFGGATIGGLITVATVVGLQRIGLGGLEDWVTGGATVQQVRRVFEKLRGRKYVGFKQFTGDVIEKVVGRGLKYAFLKGPVAKGAGVEALQEGLDAFLNTYARSKAMEFTSADDWDRPFMDRLKEGGMGAAFGAILGGGLPAAGKLAGKVVTSRQSDESVTRETLPKIARKVEKELKAKLERTGSPETAATVEEILASLEVAARSEPEAVVRQRLAERDQERKEKGIGAQERLSDVDQQIVETQIKLALAETDAEKESLRNEQAGLLTERTLLGEQSEETSTEETKKADQSDEQLQEDNTRNYLGVLGLSSIAEDVINAINDPEAASVDERAAAIGFVREHYKIEKAKIEGDKDSQSVLKEARDYLIEQLETGVTEEKAEQNLSTADGDKIEASIQETLEEGALGNKQPSGSGESVISVTDKEQLILGVFERLKFNEAQRPLGQRRTDEQLEIEAGLFVDRVMQSIRRDVGQVEDLRRIESFEGTLQIKLDEVREELDSLHEAQSRKGTKAYKAGGGRQGRKLGGKYFTEVPNTALISDVELLVGAKETEFETAETVERTARQQELTLLRSLVDVLKSFQSMNKRREEISGENKRLLELEEQVQAQLERDRLAEQRAAAAKKKTTKKKTAKKKAKKAAKKVAKAEEPLEPDPESGDTDQDSDPPASDPSRENFVQNMIASGALKARSEKEAPVAVMGVPNSLGLSAKDKGSVSNEIREEVNKEFPILGMEGKQKAREQLEEIGIVVTDRQWATVVDSKYKFGSSKIYLINDIDGGIFDNGEGNRPNEQVILFNNDPRVMQKAMSATGHLSIPIPVGFSSAQINKTFRGDRGGTTLSQDTREVYDIYYPVGSDLSSEVSILGNKGRAFVANPETITTRIVEKAANLMEFVKSNTPLRTNLTLDNLVDPETGKTPPKYFPQDVSIEEYLELFTDWFNQNQNLQLPLTSDKVAFVTGMPDPELDQSEQSIRQIYLMGLYARAQRAAVEVAILQALASKSEGQSDADVVASVVSPSVDISGETENNPTFKKALENFRSMVGEDVSVTSGRGAAAFALSEFLMGEPIAKKSQILEAKKADEDLDVVEFILNRIAQQVRASEKGRNKGAAEETLQRSVPNLYNPSRDLIKLQVDRAKSVYANVDARGMANGAQSQDDDSRPPEDTGLAMGAKVAETTKSVSGEAREADRQLREIPNAFAVKQGIYTRFIALLNANEGVAAALEGFFAGVNEDVVDLLPQATLEDTYIELRESLLSAVDLPEDSRARLVKLRKQFLTSFATAAQGEPDAFFALAELLSSDLVSTINGGVEGTFDLLGDAFEGANKSIGDVSLDQIATIVKLERVARKNNAPSFISAEHQRAVSNLNRAEVNKLGLVDGDSSSLTRAITMIAESNPDKFGESYDPRLKSFARLLLTFESYLGVGTEFKIVQGATHYAGSYDSETNTIYLNLNGRYGEGVASTILHEAGHAVFAKLMTAPDDELTPQQRAARKQMQVVYEKARDQWLKAKKRGVADPLMDYVFGTGRRVVRSGPRSQPTEDFRKGVADQSSIVDPVTGLRLYDVNPSGRPLTFATGFGSLAGGELSPTGDQADLDLAVPLGMTGDVILSRARGFEEYYTTMISSSSFQFATRKVAVENRSLFQRFMDLLAKLFGRETAVERDAVEAIQAVFDFTQARGADEYTVSPDEEQDFVIAQVQALVEQDNIIRRRTGDLVMGVLGSPQTVEDPLNLTRGARTFFGQATAEFDLYQEYSRKISELKEDSEAPTFSIDGTRRPPIGILIDSLRRRQSRLITERLIKNEVDRQVPSGIRVVYVDKGDPLPHYPEDFVTDEIAYAVSTGRKAPQPDKVEGSPVPTVVFVIDNMIDEYGLDSALDQLAMSDEVPVKKFSAGSLFFNERSNRNIIKRRARAKAFQIKDELEAIVSEEVIHAVEKLVITKAERRAIFEELGDDGLADMMEEYQRISPRHMRRYEKLGMRTDDPYITEGKERVEAVRAGDRIARTNALSEGLRLEVQRRIKSGRATEDVAMEGESNLEYDPSRPLLMKLVKRQLLGIFNKVVRRLSDIGVGVSDDIHYPKYRAMVQRIHQSLKILQDGELEALGMSVDIDTSFDPADPDRGINRAMRAFQDATDISNGEGSQKAEEFLRHKITESIRVGHLYENGKWVPSKGISTLMGYKMDPRVTRILRDYERWSESINALLKSDMREMEKSLRKAFGKEPTAEILTALNTAAGTTDTLKVDSETVKRVKANRRSVVNKVRAEVRANKRPAEHISPAAIANMKLTLEDRVLSQLQMNKVRDFRVKQQEAIEFLEEQGGSEVVSTIKKVRASIDGLSKLISENYRLGDRDGSKIELIFDRSLGIYLTRGYRIYNDIAYLNEVMKEGGKFQARRDAAMPFFEAQLLKAQKKIERKGMDALVESLEKGAKFSDAAKESEAKALKKLSKKEFSEEVTRRAELSVAKKGGGLESMNTFLENVRDIATKKADRINIAKIKKEQGAGVAAITKVQVDNLRAKGDIDEGVRYLLGQFGLEQTDDGSFSEQGLTSLFATVSNQIRMAESIGFLNDLIEIGGVKDGNMKDAFVFTFKQAEEAGLTKPDAKPYVHLKTGDRLKPISEEQKGQGLQGVFDPTFDMYVPEELYRSLKIFQGVSRGNVATTLFSAADRSTAMRPLILGAAHLVNAYLKLNSLFMLSKTVANIPAYHIRNTLTALTSYGLANLVNPARMMAEFVKAAARSGFLIKDPRYRTERSVLLQRLGIDQGQIELGYINQLSSDNQSNPYGIFYDATRDLMSLTNKDMTEQGLIKKGLIKIGKAGAFVPGVILRRLASVAQGIDSATKIAMFDTELDAIKKAKQYDIDNGVDTGFLTMTDEQMEFDAARKVRAMAPTYSEAPISAKALRKFNAFHMDPFLSFWLDQFRIVYNQVAAIPKEEMASENPVISARGAKRLASAVTVHGGISVGLPVASAMLLGINPTDEEEELLKEAAPPWGKLNRYIYLPGGLAKTLFGFMGDFEKGKLYAVDLTYINAASPVFDGMTSGVLELMRGDYKTAMTNLFGGYLKRFFNDGFMKATIDEVIANEDGKSFKESDEGAERLMGILKRTAERLVEPGNIRRLRQYYDLQNADDQDLRVSLQETITQIIAPASPREVRLGEAIRKAARRLNDERTQLVNDTFNDLADGSASLSGPEGDLEIERMAKRVVDNRLKSDQELIRLVETAKSFEQFGLNDQNVRVMLKRAGVGDARSLGIVKYGATERYIPSLQAQRRFLMDDKEFMADRFRRFQAALQKFGPKHRFTDPETGKRITDLKD